MKILKCIKFMIKKIKVLHKIFSLAKQKFKEGKYEETKNLINRYERVRDKIKL